MSEPVRVHLLHDAEHVRRRVLLLHGLANSAAIWTPVAEGWSPDVQVWAADLPWRGHADRSWSTHGDCGRWVRAALEQVPGDIDVVVAHSMSANVVLDELSTEFGSGPFSALRGVVLVAPFFRARPEDFGWDAVSRSVENFERTITDGIRAHARGRMTEQRVAELGQLVCEKVGPYAWSRFFAMYLNTPWLRTAEITTPVRVITGGADHTARPEDGAALASALPGGALRCMAGAGHFPMIERPDEFRALVTEFLDQRTPENPRGEPEARLPIACGATE